MRDFAVTFDQVDSKWNVVTVAAAKHMILVENDFVLSPLSP